MSEITIRCQSPDCLNIAYKGPASANMQMHCDAHQRLAKNNERIVRQREIIVNRQARINMLQNKLDDYEDR